MLTPKNIHQRDLTPISTMRLIACPRASVLPHTDRSSDGHDARRARRWPVTWALTMGMIPALLLAGCALAPMGPNHVSGSATSIPIKVTKGPGNDTLIEVPVYIGRSGPYQFILDTGASETLIARPLAVRLHLPRA